MGKEKGSGRGRIAGFYTSWIWRRAKEEYRRKVLLCERCGALGTQVHHKVRLTAENLNNPEISLDEKNMELLCDKCHEKEHGKLKQRADPDGHVPLDSPL